MNLTVDQQEMLLVVKSAEVASLFPEHHPDLLMRERRRLQKIKYERGYRERNYRSDSGPATNELQARLAVEEAARAGSERLCNAIHRLFSKWEDDNGFVAGAAEKLLPAGYSDQRMAA